MVNAVSSLLFMRCRRYALLYWLLKLQFRSGSIGEKSFSHFLLSILITPFEVNSMPFLPFLVGITQSNISTPRAMHSRRFQGVPTPIRYRGFSAGRFSQQSAVISYSCSSGSPTLNPPMAFPKAFREDTNAQDCLRRSS